MITLLHGDAREMLSGLESESVQTVVTSPPYYGLRKYSDDPREIGKEETPALYVAALVAVFCEVWRVLRDDGVLWLNLGDSYASNGGAGGAMAATGLGSPARAAMPRPESTDPVAHGRWLRDWGVPNKNLIGIPWRVAFALQDAGWILRSDIIWNKPNCMPESVTDRPTRAHEYLFLFAKQARYFYDAAAIAETATSGDRRTNRVGGYQEKVVPGREGSAIPQALTSRDVTTRNKRTVWQIPTQSYPCSHFATMPEALIEPCILAGSSAQACETCGAAWGRVVEKEQRPRGDAFGKKDVGSEYDHGHGGRPYMETIATRDLGFTPRCTCVANTGSAASVVLDPFGGSGTVAKVAERYQRNAILIDLNQAYIDLQERRTDGVQVELFV